MYGLESDHQLKKDSFEKKKGGYGTRLLRLFTGRVASKMSTVPSPSISSAISAPTTGE